MRKPVVGELRQQVNTGGMIALEMGSSSLERKYEKERKKAYKMAMC